MTITNSFAAKLSVAFVAVAMALTLLAPVAQAQSEEELQSQIDDLLATIAALQAQLGGGDSTAGSSTSCPALTAPMTIGAEGATVVALQTYLIGAGHAIPAGATGYFGGQTQAAVAAWQAANAVAPAAGYWGPLSLAKYNMVCTAGDDGDDDDGSTSGDLEGGEASLESFNGSDGDDTNLEEGQEEAAVADFEFDVEDGDVEVNRIDVAFDGSTNTSTGDTEPWDVFEEVAIWVDGDEIASMDASDEDEWSDDDPFTDAHTLRFSGVDWVVAEGETAEFSVVVTVAGSVDGAGSDADWNVFIPFEGIRAEDGEGIQNYIGEDDDDTAIAGVEEEVSFDIDTEGGDDELVISSSTEDPSATTFAVESSENSDWHTVLAFDLDTDDSTNDIVVETAVVTLDIGESTEDYDEVVNDAQLVIDGETYDDVTVTNADDDVATLTFDIDKELTIEAGEEVTAELQLEFKSLTGNYAEGETLVASVTTTGWEAEGADDLVVGTDITGSATGETHTLRTEGVTIEVVSTSETFVQNDDASTTDNEGTFVIEFDVTAFESDLWIDKTAATGTTATTTGVTYQVLDSNGSAVDVAPEDVLTSTASTESSQFVVNEGETETFTLTVTLDPSSSGFYTVQLYGVNFDATDVTEDDEEVQQRALPAEDFETDPLSI